MDHKLKKIFLTPVNRYLAVAFLLAFVFLALLLIFKKEFLVPPQLEINKEAASSQKAPF